MSKSFIIHKDSLSILDQLTSEQAGDLFKAIHHYQKTGEIVNDDQLITIALNPFINQFERDKGKYNAIVERNKQNIAKRWNTKNTSGKSGIPDDTKNTDNKSDSDSDSKSDKEEDKKTIIKKDTSKKFTKPNLEQVKAYCSERNNKVDPESWIDHYTANGWKVGKMPMKDWKAAIRQWERNSFGNKNLTNNKISQTRDAFQQFIDK